MVSSFVPKSDLVTACQVVLLHLIHRSALFFLRQEIRPAERCALLESRWQKSASTYITDYIYYFNCLCSSLSFPSNNRALMSLCYSACFLAMRKKMTFLIPNHQMFKEHKYGKTSCCLFFCCTGAGFWSEQNNRILIISYSLVFQFWSKDTFIPPFRELTPERKKLLGDIPLLGVIWMHAFHLFVPFYFFPLETLSSFALVANSC